MPSQRVDEAHNLACKLRLLARMLQMYVTHVLEPYGVTPSQADALYFLKAGETQPSLIARSMGLDASNLSRIIRQFEGRGWVTRTVDEANRTRVELTLTDEGLDMASRVDPHAAAVQRVLTRDISSSDRETFESVLATIGTSIERAFLEERPPGKN